MAQSSDTATVDELVARSKGCGDDARAARKALLERASKGGRRRSRRRPRSVDPTNPTEDEAHIALVTWLEATRPDLQGRWYHTPNGGHRLDAVAARLQAMGVQAGVPDFTFLRPFVRDGRLYVGLSLELKRRRGGVVRPNQRAWLDVHARCGFLDAVAEGFDAAVAVICDCYGARPLSDDELRAVEARLVGALAVG